jgi:hypothetical protein
MAHERRACDAKRVEKRDDVGRHFVNRVAGLRPIGVAESTLIDRQRS